MCEVRYPVHMTHANIMSVLERQLSQTSGVQEALSMFSISYEINSYRIDM